MDFMHILGKKEAIWNTIFSILSDGGAPKRRGVRENFPPFPPLDGPASAGHFCHWTETDNKR